MYCSECENAFMLHQISEILTDKLKSELTITANSLAGNLRMMTKAETVLKEVEKEQREADQKICQLVPVSDKFFSR